MKIKLLSMLFVVGFISANAQQLYFEMSKTSSSFDYKNSQGQELVNILPKTNNNMALGFRFQGIKNQLSFIAGATYNTYGAIGSDPILDNKYEWDVTYVGVNVGMDFKLFEVQEVIFSLKTTLGSEFLVQGSQTLNNQVYDLVKEEEFNQSFFMVQGGLALQYPINRTASIYGQYMVGKSFTAFQNNSIDNEELNFFSHGFGIGIIIKLPNTDCSF